jgi:hypothetical protein
MDHHGDWDQWHENGSDMDGDTADLGGEHLDDLGAHDLGGHDAFPEHEGYDSYEETPDVAHVSHGPDLMNEGDQDDFGHHDLVPDYGADHDEPGPPDHLVGVDPDLSPDPHAGWQDSDFPPALDLDARPEPADGYPWADPDTLGDPGHGYGLADTDHGYGLSDADHGITGAAAPGDLYAYAGLDAPGPGVDPWAQLYGSDDPATGTLARFWGPTG